MFEIRARNPHTGTVAPIQGLGMKNETLWTSGHPPLRYATAQEAQGVIDRNRERSGSRGGYPPDAHVAEIAT